MMQISAAPVSCKTSPCSPITFNNLLMSSPHVWEEDVWKVNSSSLRLKHQLSWAPPPKTPMRAVEWQTFVTPAFTCASMKHRGKDWKDWNGARWEMEKWKGELVVSGKKKDQMKKKMNENVFSFFLPFELFLWQYFPVCYHPLFAY